jgi:hypothetical protein
MDNYDCADWTEMDIDDLETENCAYSSLGVARRAVSCGRHAPGLTIPLGPRGMIEIQRKGDSWQKPAGVNRFGRSKRPSPVQAATAFDFAHSVDHQKVRFDPDGF